MRPVTRALVAVIVLVLAGDAAALTTIDDGASSPKHWDARVAQLAKFVESHRHLRYTHPVDVRFLTPAEYAKESDITDQVTDQDKKDIANLVGQERALGLIGKDTDFLKDLNTIQTGGTTAYYDPDAQEMVIRGTKLTPGLRTTVVHELTHALQDQHFDLNRELESDSSSQFFDGLVEGDAVRIERAYFDALSEADQDALIAEENADGDESDKAVEGVAPALLQLFAVQYNLGEPMTSLVVAEDGVRALDALFRHPPGSDEGLFDPLAVLTHEKVKSVARPKLRRGESRTDSGDIGPVTLYLVLSSFITERAAMTALDGWAGDSYVGYKRDNRTCIRIAIVGDTSPDVAAIGRAFTDWKAAFTGNLVTVTTTANRVEVDACEPDTIPKARPESAQSLVLPEFRFQLVNEVLNQGLSLDAGKCFAEQFPSASAKLSLDQLNPQSEEEAKPLQALGAELSRRCAGVINA